MSECTNCKDWFHPQCINAKHVSYTAMKKSLKNNDDFLCPVCQHLHCYLNNYSFESCTEWNMMHHHIHTSISNSKSGSGDNNKYDDNNNNDKSGDKNSKKTIKHDESTSIDTHIEDNKHNQSTSISTSSVCKGNRKTLQGVDHQQQHQKVKKKIKKKTISYWTITELKQVLAVENSMPILKVYIICSSIYHHHLCVLDRYTIRY